MASNFNVVESIFFGKIGIVKIALTNGDTKMYIGISNSSSKAINEQKIARNGQPLNQEILIKLLSK